MITFNTERLLLRDFRLDDLEALHEICKNPNVGLNAGWEPHKSIAETQEMLNTLFLNEESIWAIEMKRTNQLIGSIGLMCDPKRQNPNALMIGYSIGEKYWNNGYTTEAAKAIIKHAFGSLKASLISAYTYPKNARSRRLLEKCGFIYEGCLHQSELLFNGDILDNELYSLTISQYNALQTTSTK